MVRTNLAHRVLGLGVPPSHTGGETAVAYTVDEILTDMTNTYRFDLPDLYNRSRVFSPEDSAIFLGREFDKEHIFLF